jgi:hypothetical protein
MGLPPRAPPGVQYSRRRGRDGRRDDDPGGGGQLWQVVAAMFLRSDRLSRTLLSAGQMAAQSRLRRSHSLNHVMWSANLDYGGLIP